MQSVRRSRVSEGQRKPSIERVTPHSANRSWEQNTQLGHDYHLLRPSGAHHHMRAWVQEMISGGAHRMQTTGGCCVNSARDRRCARSMLEFICQYLVADACSVESEARPHQPHITQINLPATARTPGLPHQICRPKIVTPKFGNISTEDVSTFRRKNSGWSNLLDTPCKHLWQQCMEI